MNAHQKRLSSDVDRLSREMVSLARYIAKHPELAHEEFEAQKRLIQFLKRHGFQVKKGVGGVKTSFLATRKFGKGPNIGFLAEYDALPEIGHACGHHLIGAASCGAAIALSRQKNIAGTITVVGCPAEEGGGAGKVMLAKRGVFKNLSVAMMAHPDYRTETLKKMLSLVEMDIEFFGKIAHAAAAPEQGINALDAAVGTFNDIQTYLKTLGKDARINGIFTSGGTKPSIIPDHAALKYYVRSLQMKTTRAMIARVKKIAQKNANKVGAKLKICQNPWIYEPFHPNRTLANIFRKQLKVLGIKDEQGSETKGIGSSDVGNVGQVVPTIHPMYKICDRYFCHTAPFREAAQTQRAYQAMIAISKALAFTAHDVMMNRHQLNKVRKEFRKMRRA